MKSKYGFTLIELLIVIAIIAILVLIVIIAISPVRTLNNARDRTAASNVRTTGTLISVCIGDQLSQDPPLSYELCGTNGLPLTSYGSIPTGVSVDTGAALGDNDVCASQQGSDANWFNYRYSTGQVSENVGTMPAAAPRCP